MEMVEAEIEPQQLVHMRWSHTGPCTGERSPVKAGREKQDIHETAANLVIGFCRGFDPLISLSLVACPLHVLSY